jgi:hypothetical protein
MLLAHALPDRLLSMCRRLHRGVVATADGIVSGEGATKAVLVLATGRGQGVETEDVVDRGAAELERPVSLGEDNGGHVHITEEGEL